MGYAGAAASSSITWNAASWRSGSKRCGAADSSIGPTMILGADVRVLVLVAVEYVEVALGARLDGPSPPSVLRTRHRRR